MSIKHKSGLHRSHKIVLIAVFVLAVVLISSLLVYMYVENEALGPIHVKHEAELRQAIDEVAFGESAAIVLDDDITLIGELRIPVGKNITLSSNGDSFFKLIGAVDVTTLNVDAGGILRLERIIVSHASGDKGWGIEVSFGGVLIIDNSEVIGGGVINNGNFTMLSGKISDNADIGVANDGIFTMLSGKISDNADIGVANDGIFTMLSGKISDNSGNGVVNSGTFTMSEGMISGNTALTGGGVFNNGVFEMLGGVISGNTATHYGGGVYNNGYGGSFTMSGGTISGNTATYAGGGLYTRYSDNYSLLGGTITGNTADTGSDIYN